MKQTLPPGLTLTEAEVLHRRLSEQTQEPPAEASPAPVPEAPGPPSDPDGEA